MELAEILYSSISDYGEQRILSDVVQGDSADVIKTILDQCFANISKIEGNKTDTLVTFAEGLLHYLLTIAMIPSQRKTVFQLVEIDIAVPDTRTLAIDPKEVILIFFPKTSDVDFIKSQIEKLNQIQPNSNNIWVILENNISINAKIYTLKNSMTFVNIINDLISFSSDKKQSKLKIFKI